MNYKYTISEMLYEASSSNKWDCTDEVFEDGEYPRQYLSFNMRGSGCSVDFRDDNGNWYEEEMLYEGFEPFQADDNFEEIFASYGDKPFRTHGYKSIYIRFTLELPPNRKRGDRYSQEEIIKMVVDTNFAGDDVPGMGFTYYNCGDDEE